MSLRYDGLAMPVQITIDDVPEEVRDELATRAALRRQTLEEYVRCELERMVSRPTVDAWLREVRAGKQAMGRRISAAEILKARDEGRA